MMPAGPQGVLVVDRVAMAGRHPAELCRTTDAWAPFLSATDSPGDPMRRIAYWMVGLEVVCTAALGIAATPANAASAVASPDRAGDGSVTARKPPHFVVEFL